MSKYVLYRTAIDDQPIDEELVAVEFGASFEDVLEDLLQAIRDDLSGSLPTLWRVWTLCRRRLWT